MNRRPVHPNWRPKRPAAPPAPPSPSRPQLDPDLSLAGGQVACYRGSSEAHVWVGAVLAVTAEKLGISPEAARTAAGVSIVLVEIELGRKLPAAEHEALAGWLVRAMSEP